MKKIGLGIAILLFAILFALLSVGMESIAFLTGIIGLAFAITGFLEK